MKKTTKLNKQIIKALAIGISASMMMSPLSAMAADLEENPTPVEPENNTEEESKATVTAIGAAQAQVPVVEEADENAAEKVDEAVSAAESQLITDEATIEAAKELAEAVKTLDKAEDTTGNDDESDAVEGGDDQEGEEPENENTPVVDDKEVVEDGNTTVAINDVEKQLEVVEEQDTVANAALGAATALGNEIDKIASDAKQAEEDALEEVIEKVDEIKNAETIADANQAYEDAKDIIDDADETYAQAVNDYNAKKDQYDEAIKALDAAKKAYDEAVEAGETDLETAASELKDLEDKADALKKASDEAYKKLSTTEEGKIVILEEKAANDKTPQWNGTLDPLFKSIMENYLIEHLNEGATDIKITVKKFANSDYNYFEVTFKNANGETETKYYDYVLSDGNAAGGLVIYEKTESFIYGKNDANRFTLDDDEKDELAEGGFVVKNGDTVVSNEKGDGYVVAGAKDATTTELDSNQTVVESTVTETVRTTEDGSLVKETKGDVVTTIETAGSVASGAGVTYGSVAEATAAANAAINAEIAEGSEVKDVDVQTAVSTTVYSSTQTYYVTFTKTIDVNKTDVSGWDGPLSNNEDEAKRTVIANIKKDVDKDDYYVSTDSANLSAVHENWISGGEGVGIGEYTVTGNVTYTYVDTESDKTGYSIVGDFFGISDSKEDVTAKLDAKLEENGYVRVGDVTGFDWSVFKCTYEYTRAYTVTATGSTADEAKANAIAKANEEAEKLSVYEEETITETVNKTNNGKGSENGNGYDNGNAYGHNKTQEVTTTVKKPVLVAKAVILEDKEKNTSSSLYTYEATYTEVSTSTENVVLESTTWTKDELKEAKLRYTNENLTSGNITLAEYDKDYTAGKNKKGETKELTDEQKAETEAFREYLAGAKNQMEAYKDLSGKALDATDAVKAAEEEVKELKDKLDDLKNGVDFDDERSKLDEQLDKAVKNLDAAKDKKDEVDGKDKDAKDALDKRTAELTPAPQPTPDDDDLDDDDDDDDNNNGGTGNDDNTGDDGNNGGDDNNTGDDGNNGDDDNNIGDDDNNGGDNNNNGNDDEEVTIVDEEVPAADVPTDVETEETVVEENADEEVVVEETVVEEATVDTTEEIDIIDEETAKADAPVVEEIDDEDTPKGVLADQSQMPWWWLLIVLVLGTTGAELYRRHLVKKNAIKVESNDKSEK